MLIIGLTGGIGSGKSTVTAIFESLGVSVIDTDLIARQVVEPGQPGLQQIIEHFGSAILTKDGQLDRAALRRIIFTNAEEKSALENILHPLIRKTALKRINELHTAYCILCVPLLIESGWQDLVDRILVIDTTPELQLERASQRDRIPEAAIKAIMQSQVERSTRLQQADDVITNTGTVAKLRHQVESLHQRYLELALH